MKFSPAPRVGYRFDNEGVSGHVSRDLDGMWVAISDDGFGSGSCYTRRQAVQCATVYTLKARKRLVGVYMVASDLKGFAAPRLVVRVVDVPGAGHVTVRTADPLDRGTMLTLRPDQLDPVAGFAGAVS